MARPTLCALMIASLIGGAAISATPSLGQEAKKDEIKKENPLPPGGSAGGQNHSDQNAKQESSSKVEGTNPLPEVLVNGALTAPGSPTDVDTVPSKFSARTAVDDKQPIAAYRLKHLTDAQRGEIRKAIGGATSPGLASRALDGFAQVGAEIPTSVALEQLRPIPASVLGKVPGMNGTVYVVSEGKVLLVNATTRVVVGVLE